MCRIKNFLIFGIIFFMVSLSFGQELLTLNEAIKIALEKNHQIRVARNTAKISNNNASAGNAGFLPKVDLTSGVNYNDMPVQTLSAKLRQKSTRNSVKIAASYNLFNGLGDYYTFDKLKAQATGGELSARNNIEQTLILVISAYYNLSEAEEGLNIRKQALQISRERLQRTKKKATYGQANKIDLLNARVDFNADTVSYLDVGLQEDEARRNLNLLLGRNVNENYTVENTVHFTNLSPLAEIKQEALKKNASYLLTVNGLRQSKDALRQTQAPYYPRLDLGASYGYSQTVSDLDILLDNPDHSLEAGLSMSFNLFNGFRNHIQSQNARINLNNQQILLQQARLKLEKDIENAYAAYRNKRYILKIEKTNLSSAELNFRRSKELFNLGHLTNTQFRAAQLSLVQARYGISHAKFQAKIAEAQLLQLSGELLKSEK